MEFARLKFKLARLKQPAAIPGWTGVGWKVLERLSTLDFIGSKLSNMGLHLTSGDVACLVGIVWLAWLAVRDPSSGSPAALFAQAREFSRQYREMVRRWPDSEAVNNPAAIFWHSPIGVTSISADHQTVMEWTGRLNAFLAQDVDLFAALPIVTTFRRHQLTHTGMRVLEQLAGLEDALWSKVQQSALF